MSVAQKDKIDDAQLVKLQGWLREAFRTDRNEGQTRKKDGVGQHCYAKEIEEHGRVSEPGSCQAVVRPLVWRRPGERGRDWRSRLNDPFVPKTKASSAKPLADVDAASLSGG